MLKMKLHPELLINPLKLKSPQAISLMSRSSSEVLCIPISSKFYGGVSYNMLSKLFPHHSHQHIEQTSLLVKTYAMLMQQSHEKHNMYSYMEPIHSVMP